MHKADQLMPQQGRPSLSPISPFAREEALLQVVDFSSI